MDWTGVISGNWETIAATIATVLIALLGSKFLKYRAFIKELSDALKPDKDGRIRITKHEIRRLVLRAQSFSE